MSIDTSADTRRSSVTSVTSSTLSSSQPQQTEDIRLDFFGRHIPYILMKQLIAKLTDQFMNQTAENDFDQVGAFSCTPSIGRFDAALLFVDISGFTVLSQRLPVDELRLCINNYFKIILDTIMASEGDVIKFAGDALFVIWQVEESREGRNGKDIKIENKEQQSTDRMKAAVEKAVRCGVEINRLCSNYRVNFKKKLTNNDESITDLVMQQNQLPLPAAVSPQKENEDDHTYLNVHSGCSCGTFAGIDVGAMDRWEYLMIGDPLQDVADAESAAEKGELVISSYAHDIICSGVVMPTTSEEAKSQKNEFNVSSAGDNFLPCGCKLTSNGCYRMNPVRVVNLIELPQVSDEEEDEPADYESIYFRCMIDTANRTFEMTKPYIMRNFISLLNEGNQRDRCEGESDVKKGMVTSASFPTFITSTPQMEQHVYDFYIKWLVTCLTSDIARHVHEADRGNFEMSRESRLNCLTHCAQKYKTTTSEKLDFQANVQPINSRDSSDSFVRRIRNLVTSASKPIPNNEVSSRNNDNEINARNSNYLREKNQKKHEKLLRTDRELTGELRNVIVMFIAIKSEKKVVTLIPLEEEEKMKEAESAFTASNFLERSKTERDADTKLKKHYQICMSLIVSSLKEKGGQLRQFIVDDKGTVAIGSFGLRGSTTYDNAASAVEAASNIIVHLQNVGLNASIGITSGRAYCGVVGSVKRHEYAVMGPSVNLSARLMGQAKPGEIICDVSTRSVDRIHSYRAVGQVKAKGYADLVSIFKPVLHGGSVTVLMREHSVNRSENSSFRVAAPSNDSAEQIRHVSSIDEAATPYQAPSSVMPSKTKKLVGREDEEFEVLNLILHDIIDDKAIDFTKTVKEIQSGSYDNMLISDTLLNTACSARIVVVNGTSGIGKSALLDSICDKLSRFTKKTTWNLQIFHGKSSSLTVSDPFKPWHSVIRSILSQLARYSHIVNERREDELTLSDRSLTVKKWLKGLDYLSSYLSEEDRNWFPLLTTANIVPGINESEITKKLSGQQKLEVITKLLKSIVNQYPILTNKVLMIVLDDSHFMDPHSWKLTHEILQSSKGVLFLASYYDANEEVNIPSVAQSPPEGPAEVLSSKVQTVGGGSQLQDMIFELSSCRKIKLNGLDATAIRHMAGHIFEGMDLRNVDENIFTILEEMSGGNPLYIYEIGLACLEKMKGYIGDAGGKVTDLFLMKDGSKSIFSRLMGEFRTNRIDEVIYYRFDRLDAQSQLLLKMGAIITISNSHRGFNVEMLIHMLYNEEKEEMSRSSSLLGLFSCLELSSDIQNQQFLHAAQLLRKKLQEIVSNHSFIKIIQTRRRSSFNDSDRVNGTKNLTLRTLSEEEDLNQINEALGDENSEEKLRRDMSEVYYDFNISLERKTIYDLMLDDQKESLHDRVADHLEKENEHAEKSNYVTFSDLNEEAFHWEKATVWGNAMSCYYRAGMILDSLGAFKESYEYLGKAYRMLVLLRKDAKIKENIYHQIKFDTLLQEFIFLNNQLKDETVANEESIDQRLSAKESLTSGDYSLTRIDVYNTFGGDATLLEVAINLLLRFGQASFTLGENAAITSRIYEDAIRLMLLTWPRTHNHQDDQSDFTDHHSHHNKRTQQIDGTKVKLNEIQARMDAFKLKDPSICFPLIAGMATLYRNRRLPDDENHSNEKCLYSIMLNFAKLAPEYYQIHYLQAVCLMNSLHNELGHYDEANQLLPEILSLYNAEQHSAALVKTYGNDRIPYTLAVIAQTLLLLGYLPQAMILLQQLTNDWLPTIPHLHSMGILSLPLTSIQLLMSHIPQAEKVFMYYRRTELSREGAYSFFKEMNEIIQDYFAVKKYSVEGNHEALLELFGYCDHEYCLKPTSEQKNDASTTLSSHLITLVQKITNKTYYKKENRPLLFDVILSFGISVEGLCADLLIMITESVLHLKSDLFLPGNLLSLALDYCELAIDLTKIGHRLMFSYMSLLIIKLRILLMLVPQAEENKQKLFDHLKMCLEIARVNDFTFIEFLIIKRIHSYQRESIFSSKEYEEIFQISFSKEDEERKTDNRKTEEAESISNHVPSSSSSDVMVARIEKSILLKLETKNNTFYHDQEYDRLNQIFDRYLSADRLMDVLNVEIQNIFSTVPLQQ